MQGVFREQGMNPSPRPQSQTFPCYCVVSRGSGLPWLRGDGGLMCTTPRMEKPLRSSSKHSVGLSTRPSEASSMTQAPPPGSPAVPVQSKLHPCTGAEFGPVLPGSAEATCPVTSLETRTLRPLRGLCTLWVHLSQPERMLQSLQQPRESRSALPIQTPACTLALTGVPSLQGLSLTARPGAFTTSFFCSFYFISSKTGDQLPESSLPLQQSLQPPSLQHCLCVGSCLWGQGEGHVHLLCSSLFGDGHEYFMTGRRMFLQARQSWVCAARPHGRPYNKAS